MPLLHMPFFHMESVMRLVLLGVLLLAGCGDSPKAEQPPERQAVAAQELELSHAQPSQARVGLAAVLEASRTCRGFASAMMRSASEAVPDRSALLEMAERGVEACIADRLAIFNLGLNEPAETTCLRITGSGMGAIGAIRRWVESPGANEENTAQRSVALIGEAEKECGTALARQGR